MVHESGDERDVVADAVDREGVEGPRLRVDRLKPRRRVGDELCDHRVVVDRDLAALVNAGVVAYRGLALAPLLGRAIGDEAPRRGQEVARRVFGVDAAFDGPAVEPHVLLAQAQLFARGDADHLLDEVDAGDHLGHRMLDLQPRVHLEEIEGAVLPGDELDRSGGIVADGPGERDGLLAHLPPRRLVEQRRRRLLDDFLVATLDRALALAEIDDVAVLVAEHLDLDVARVGDELFDEDAVVAEARRGLGLRAGKAFGDLAGGIGDAHALAAAAGRGLDHHRIADLVGDADRLLRALR